MSSHESNHYACQEAQLFTFENMLNNIKIQFALRICSFTCSLIQKLKNYLILSSVLLNEVRSLSLNKYGIGDIFDNDKEAVKSRVVFVQIHEIPMRWAEKKRKEKGRKNYLALPVYPQPNLTKLHLTCIDLVVSLFLPMLIWIV